MTTKEFIVKSRHIHGDKFDYSLAHYINLETNVQLKCNRGHVFWQRPDNHLRKTSLGCPKCTGKGKYSQSDFLDKAKRVHGNKYNLDKTIYIPGDKHIIINCPDHGDFTVRSSLFLSGHGCRQCFVDKVTKSQLDFIQDAKIAHGNRYDYSNVKYINYNTKVEIICHKHGSFFKTPGHHITNEQGCPKCKASQGELRITRFLDNHSIQYSHNHRFAGCRKKLPLRFDFYLPQYKTCIEFDGAGHFLPIWGEKPFKHIQESDQIKKSFCLDKNLTLVRILAISDIQETLLTLIYPITI